MSRGSVNDYAAKIAAKHEGQKGKRPTTKGVFPIPKGEFQVREKSKAPDFNPLYAFISQEIITFAADATKYS